MKSGKFTPQSLEETMAQQLVVQEKKDRLRNVSMYDMLLFDPEHYVPDLIPSKISKFLEKSFESKIEGISDLLLVLEKAKGDSVHWVEMGGGLALPMRELAQRHSIKMTNVDLFEVLAKESCEKFKSDVLRVLNIDLDDQELEPKFLNADITDVELPERADLITSVQAIQYLDNPLEAICNWYNQLTDDGILLLATEHSFNNWMRISEKEDLDLFTQFLEFLEKSEIDFVAPNINERFSLAPRFDKLMLIKKPNTELKFKLPLQEVWVNPHDYKAAYYNLEQKKSFELILQD